MSLETLTYEALKLNQADRIALARLILESVDEENNTSSNILDTQLIEIKRRIALYENGKLARISSKTVHRNISKKY